jgi:hypothetical protein
MMDGLKKSYEFDIDRDNVNDFNIVIHHSYGRLVGFESFIQIIPNSDSEIACIDHVDTTYMSTLKYNTQWNISLLNIFTQDSVRICKSYSKYDRINTNDNFTKKAVMIRYNSNFVNYRPAGYPEYICYGLNRYQEKYIAIRKLNSINNEREVLAWFRLKIYDDTSLIINSSHFVIGQNSLLIE